MMTMMWSAVIVCGEGGGGGGGNCFVSLHPLHTVIWSLMAEIKCCYRLHQTQDFRGGGGSDPSSQTARYGMY